MMSYITFQQALRHNFCNRRERKRNRPFTRPIFSVWRKVVWERDYPWGPYFTGKMGPPLCVSLIIMMWNCNATCIVTSITSRKKSVVVSGSVAVSLTVSVQGSLVLSSVITEL